MRFSNALAENDEIKAGMLKGYHDIGE